MSCGYVLPHELDSNQNQSDFKLNWPIKDKWPELQSKERRETDLQGSSEKGK